MTTYRSGSSGLESVDDPIAVHIVDDDSYVRDSLQLLMISEKIPVRIYASAKEFLASYSEDTAGCILLDIRMPEMDGLQLQQELAKRNAAIPIIILTGHGDIQLAVKAMKMGARDFIEKPFDNANLLERVNACLVCGQELFKKHRTVVDIEENMARLTSREIDVLDKLVEGKLNKVIGAELGISARTVEIHRANIMDKLKAKSLPDVVRMYMTIHQSDSIAKC